MLLNFTRLLSLMKTPLNPNASVVIVYGRFRSFIVQINGNSIGILFVSFDSVVYLPNVTEQSTGYAQ